MKIQLFSDLHLEFQDYKPQPSSADVVVLAGDIYSKGRGVAWAEQHFTQPVIFVLGNHDYWGGNIERTMAKMKEQAAARGQVHILNAESLVLDGVRFYGATFWTDFDIGGQRPLAMLRARTVMNDYRRIRHGVDYHRFTPDTARRLHSMACINLKRTLEEPFEGPTVVVSHHAPHQRSIEQRSTGDVLEAAYASDLSRFMGPGVDLWLHGHTHDSLDYVQDGTRVVCNPRGYVPSEVNDDFLDEFIIELDTRANKAA